MKDELKNKDLKKVIGGTNINPDINRDLNISPNNNDIGNTSDNNSIPGEIKPRETK